MQMSKLRHRLTFALTKLRMRYLRPGRLTTLPTVLTLELSSRCSLACSCCPNGKPGKRTRRRVDMSKADFDKMLANIDLPVRNVFLHLHGEPFLNENISEIAEALASRGIEEFNIFSNAYRIDVNRLSRLLTVLRSKRVNICFSAELYDRAVYERLRCPGRYDVLWESLDAIDRVMAEQDCEYSINAIVDAESIGKLKERVPAIFERLSQLKDIHFSGAFPWPHLPETGDIAGHLRSRRTICSQIWQMPVVYASGEVGMCSSDYDGESVIGSLLDSKMSELVNNKAARRFRRNIAMRRHECNLPCRDCLIDRHESFSRVVRRRFAVSASADALEKYFNSFKKYFFVATEDVRTV